MPPPTGSFKDLMVRTLDTRQRNLRFAEVSMFAWLVQMALKVPPDAVKSMLELYEAELYQDAYVPAFQQAQRVKQRRAQQAEAEKKRREFELLKKVDRFSGKR